MLHPYSPTSEAATAHGPIDLLLAKVRGAQRLTPEQRILAGAQQSELAINVVRDGIRDRYPTADAETVERLLHERIALMRELERRSGEARSGAAR